MIRRAFVLAVLLLNTNLASAQSSAMAQDTLRFLARLNSPGALQTAACHGSIGTDVGAGVESYNIPAEHPLLNSQLGLPTNALTSYSVPRLWLTKGLPIPVDLGLTASVPGPSNGLSQVSGSLQWTLYQALARPAFAVRASYGRLYGSAGTSVITTGGEAVASYGFLRYFTVYGRVGVLQQRASLTLNQNTIASYALSDDPQNPMVNATWYQPERAAGLRLTLWSPFLALTSEADFSYGAKPDYALKLSYTM